MDAHRQGPLAEAVARTAAELAGQPAADEAEQNEQEAKRVLSALEKNGKTLFYLVFVSGEQSKHADDLRHPGAQFHHSEWMDETSHNTVDGHPYSVETRFVAAKIAGKREEFLFIQTRTTVESQSPVVETHYGIQFSNSTSFTERGDVDVFVPTGSNPFQGPPLYGTGLDDLECVEATVGVGLSELVPLRSK